MTNKKKNVIIIKSGDLLFSGIKSCPFTYIIKADKKCIKRTNFSDPLLVEKDINGYGPVDIKNITTIFREEEGGLEEE